MPPTPTLRVLACHGTSEPERRAVGLVLETAAGPLELVLDEAAAAAIELALRLRVRAPPAVDVPSFRP